VGVPGLGSSGPAGHHPGVHGPADHGGDRQPEGAHAEGETRSHTCLFNFK